jgi:hypothetical protein
MHQSKPTGNTAALSLVNRQKKLLQNDTFIVSFTVPHIEAGAVIFPLIFLRNLTDDTASVSKELHYLVFKEYL